MRPEWAEALEPVVDDLRRSCGLQPATLSKFEAGLLALGIHVPEPPDLGPTEVTPTSSAGRPRLRRLRRNLAVLLAREPGTRLGEDIEELHDMRVATRRLRAAIDFFGEVLPVRARTLRAELSWLADVLGGVRDLDVQIERLDDMERWAWPTGPDGSPLVDLRAPAHSASGGGPRCVLLDALDSARWERLAAGLTSMVRASPRGRPLAGPATGRHRPARPGELPSPGRGEGGPPGRRSGVAADYHRAPDPLQAAALLARVHRRRLRRAHRAVHPDAGPPAGLARPHAGRRGGHRPPAGPGHRRRPPATRRRACRHAPSSPWAP